MSSVAPDLSENVSKLVELTKQLTEAKSDIKVLTQEEKRLKEKVKKHMVEQGIDTINLRKGKISIRKSVRKSGMSKDAIKEGLMTFFGGDETKVEGALNAIKDGLKTKESTSISLSGIQEKPEKEDKSNTQKNYMRCGIPSGHSFTMHTSNIQGNSVTLLRFVTRNTTLIVNKDDGLMNICTIYGKMSGESSILTNYTRRLCGVPHFIILQSSWKNI
jgi:hypothetical protein